MKRILVLLIVVSLISCTEKVKEIQIDFENEKNIINTVVNGWHLDAAEANFDPYFEKMTSTGVFIGTDAEENWTIAEFKEFCKPHFDKGKAWDFTSLERNIYVDTKGQIAWFDELLDTWMGVCRGSGVLKKVEDSWKIEHYVLSLTIPNDNIQEVVKINTAKDSLLLKKLRKLN